MNLKPVEIQEAELKPTPYNQVYFFFQYLSNFQKIVFLTINLKHDLPCYWKSGRTYLTGPCCFPTTIKSILVDHT